MHRNLVKLAAVLLLGVGTHLLHAADKPTNEAATQIIRWTGSAYKEGDAFIVVAEIFPSEVKLHWDGFGGASFEFLDDQQQESPPRVKKDYLIEDETTVQAFKTLVAQVEQCNPGESGAIGQGVSTNAVVESPPGKTVKEMSFFTTPSFLVKPRRFESIPSQLRSLADKELPELIPAESTFAVSIRDLAADLSRFADCHDKLLAGYKAKGDLPLPEMEALQLPVPFKRALAQRQLARIFHQTKAAIARQSGKLLAIKPITEPGSGNGANRLSAIPI